MPQDTLEQRAVLWTQALVRVPSVSGSPACLQVLETARDLIESTGVEADIRILFPEAPNPVLLARTGRGKTGVPELMLSGHVDVVPPAGMEDPWSARIEGDRMHGRGTTDMKSGAACALTTFCEAARQGVDGVLWLILSTDEETAAQGVVRALGSPDAPRPQLCVICEPTGLCVRSAHRGDCWIRVDFTGKSAHSSRPHLGINAIEAAALFIVHAKNVFRNCSQKTPQQVRPHPLLILFRAAQRKTLFRQVRPSPSTFAIKAWSPPKCSVTALKRF